MSLTWEAYNSQVRAYLYHYNGVVEAQNLIDTLIPAGVEDLQRTIEFYQTGHKDTYSAAALTSQGFVQLGALPKGRIRSARLVKFDTTDGLLRPNVFRSLCQVSWQQVPAMRGGEVNAFMGLIAVDPVTRMFAIAPPLNSETRLVIEWIGVKSAFQPEDETPFDAQAAEAVALYVLAKITRVIDRDLTQANSYIQSYTTLKRQLLSESRWNAVVEDVPSQSGGDDAYTESTTSDLMALFSYRPDITALIGGLDQLPTVDAIATESLFLLVISGIPQYWRLVSGADATDINAGFLRPADYNASTNVRVWARLT